MNKIWKLNACVTASNSRVNTDKKKNIPYCPQIVVSEAHLPAEKNGKHWHNKAQLLNPFLSPLCCVSWQTSKESLSCPSSRTQNASEHNRASRSFSSPSLLTYNARTAAANMARPPIGAKAAAPAVTTGGEVGEPVVGVGSSVGSGTGATVPVEVGCWAVVGSGLPVPLPLPAFAQSF